MANLSPYLKFNGNCREAFEFYKECLGGELTINTVAESPMAAQMPAEAQNQVLHAMLKNENLVLMGSDMMGNEAVQGNTVVLCLECTSKEEITGLFEKFSTGGNITHPLKEEFFGTYGDLTDKYGMHWMFQCDTAQ